MKSPKPNQTLCEVFMSKTDLLVQMTRAIRTSGRFDVIVTRTTKWRRNQELRFTAQPHPNPALARTLVFDVTALEDKYGNRDFDAAVNRTFPDAFKFAAAIMRYRKLEAKRPPILAAE
jgi:hypothetical protein